MGPRSDNRGYARRPVTLTAHATHALQWVHGPITVVMTAMPSADRRGTMSSFNGSTVR